MLVRDSRATSGEVRSNGVRGSELRGRMVEGKEVGVGVLKEMEKRIVWKFIAG